MFYLLTQKLPQKILSDIKDINALAWHVTTGREIIQRLRGVLHADYVFLSSKLIPHCQKCRLQRDSLKKY